MVFRCKDLTELKARTELRKLCESHSARESMAMEELRELYELYRREAERYVAQTPEIANRPAKRGKNPRAKG